MKEKNFRNLKCINKKKKNNKKCLTPLLSVLNQDFCTALHVL